MNYKNLKVFYILDGVIVLIANACGVFVPQFFDSTSLNSQDMILYLKFLESKQEITGLLTFVTFLIPLFLCVYYANTKNKVLYVRRFINSPLMFALIGIAGWVVAFLTGIMFLLWAKISIHISVIEIFFETSTFIILSALMTFAISFFSIEFIHRSFLLKKYFPNGHFGKFNYKFKPTFIFITFIVYVSSAVFPLTFLISAFFEVCSKTNYKVSVSKIIMEILLLVVGLFLQISYSRYFSNPIKKLKKAVEHIKNGDFTHKISFVSNDEFGDLVDTFNDMSESLLEKDKKLALIQNSIIKGMATMIESRDNSTGGHINRTSEYVQLFVNYLYQTKKYELIDEEFVKNITKAAPMHDLGKISIDDAILRKQEPFTTEDYEIMKTHTTKGAIIVESVLAEVDDETFKQIAINVAHYHHEKWNGTGYPKGIKGEEIPFEARIMALADVYDALVSKRCYKEKFTFEKAFSIIEESSGTHFDLDLTKEFLICRNELENLTNSLSE